MIKLIKGSIFDTKCDLIIIPCDILGGVTLSVQNELMVNYLPYLKKPIEIGDIHFTIDTGTFSNASMIGYAASVNVKHSQTSSNGDYIKSILEKIKNKCKEYLISKVNIPLLGTGAGGLDHEYVFSMIKEIFEKDSDVLLCVYAFSENIYKKLSKSKSNDYNKTIKSPRVFISYTGTNIDNKKWVKDFAIKLRNNGVNARIDIFHLKPGQDLPQWMTNEIIISDKILLICDKYYAEKADYRKGGVGWEPMIIQGDMLSKQEQNKYVAILRDKDIDQSLPVYVKSKYALDWSSENQNEQNFKNLMIYLFDCDIEPPLGEIPTFIKEKFKNI